MSTMLVAWIAFPLALAALGLGWGTLVERAAGARLDGVLRIPLGLAAALVVAGTLTAFSATAPAAVPLVAVGAGLGLVLAWPLPRPALWPLLCAVGVLLAYGAPVLLSGKATFTGFIRLDDTSTWFNIIDHVFADGRPVTGQASSTYALVYSGDVGPTYPLGAFMLAGLARALVGSDIAWVFQPYLACCGAALSLCVYSLTRPLVPSIRVRALLAFTAAQPALLYGYSLWGGIKELTAAFLLALGVALIAPLLARRPASRRGLIPLAVAAGALIQTLGVGAAAWVVPALAVLAGTWLLRARRAGGVRPALISLAWLMGATAAVVLPLWVVLGDTLSSSGGGTTFSTLFSSGQSAAVKLGNLIHPLSVFQLAGIWPVGDFRLTAPTVASAFLIGLVLLAATATIVWSVLRGQLALAGYVGVALIGCAVIYLSGGTPWVTGKALAIASPALLVAALAGASALWGARGRRRLLGLGGALVAVCLLGGVVWSNVLGYHDATLTPRGPLADLEHIGGLLSRRGPTFMNAYEIYGDRHFLRAGDPVEPAEYRVPTLPLKDGTVLTKSAAADIDSFPPAELDAYPSIVTPRTPVESRPPSDYRLVWRGRYYELWQRRTGSVILDHISLGESNAIPFCGQSQSGRFQPQCSVNPAATPPCSQIRSLAPRARAEGAELVAYERAEPIVARGDQTLWPGRWFHDAAARTLSPTTPGTAVSHIVVGTDQVYELWLGGSFTRGFHVSVDGRHVGTVENGLAAINGYVDVADVSLSAGVHTFAITYPNAGLSPGSGENNLTTLSAIVLQPEQSLREALLTVAPDRATQLCGRPLDWIELVRSA